MHKQSAPRGTRDVLPAEWEVWHRVLDVLRRRFEAAGYGRILTPTFEHTEVFSRAVGETTDIVGKEMYTFEDRGGRSLSLRPEGTAAVVRAFVEHGMHRMPQPVKLWYHEPMFRYERPQEGRYREHWQIGAEVFGSPTPTADAELIHILDASYRELGIPNLTLRINSIGAGATRDTYRTALVAFLRDHMDSLDEDTQRRIETNPLRAFDSKDASTIAVMEDAPLISDYLDEPAREHFESLQGLLSAAGVAYVVDPRLVRGLDYYTSTVFEFGCSDLGAQDAVGGGGRYDALVEQLGGVATPAVGFGSGIERIMLALQAGDAAADHATHVAMYVGAESATDQARAFALATQLRDRGIAVELDVMQRGAGRQRKLAQQLRVPLRVLVAGDAVQLHPRHPADAIPTELPWASAVDSVQSVLQQIEQQQSETP